MAAILVAAGFIFFSGPEDPPEVKAIVELRNVTDEEYKSNTVLHSIDKSDLKKVYLEVSIAKSKECKKRDITIPDLNIMDRLGEIRSLYGGSAEINNLGKEDTASAQKYVIFDSTGLSLSDLKEIYANQVISVDFTTANDQKTNSRYDIGKLLEYEN